MTSEEVWQAARFLHEAHRARTPYQPLPDGISPRDINEAYDIQEAFHELLLPERGAIVGYKVALTTTVMQQMVGFGHPASGAVFTSGVHHSPVSINASDYVHVGAECEIAMLLEQDLPASAAPYDRESVARAVAALMPAFELVDDRGADYTDLYFLNVAADNSWNAGIVLGEAVIDWQGPGGGHRYHDYQRSTSRRRHGWRRARTPPGSPGLAGQQLGGTGQKPPERHDRHDRQHSQHQVPE